MKRYRALVGLSYPASKKDLALCLEGKDYERREVKEGEVADDIPSESIPWLLTDGSIEEVTGGDLRS